MRQKIAVGVFMMALFGASEARAGIVFGLEQGAFQPPNLLFNLPGLLDDAATVQGVVDGTLYNISSDEVLLTPSGGQARVTAADTNGFDLLFLSPTQPNTFFSQFEANLHIAANTSGAATIVACNQLGSFGATAPFAPSGPIVDNGPCESFSFNLGNGQNFFTVATVDGQLLRGIRIETTTPLTEALQIRVGASVAGGGNPVTAVPEPGSLILLGGGLLAGARAFRKRRMQSIPRNAAE